MAKAKPIQKPAKIGRVQVKVVHATRYDAAESHAGNEKHWQYATGISAVTANSAHVRTVLRNRARYEIANNTYAAGIVETLANDTIGTGPRLQLATGDTALNRRINRAFTQWATAVGLAEKLRTMKMAQVGDGEAFALLRTNPKVRHPVKLDLVPVEADQITEGIGWAHYPEAQVEGIRFDAAGNVRSYLMLPTHPGDLTGLNADPVAVPSDKMLHWFKARRPGQRRGIPEITPALPLFANLRRYTLAVVEAAEIAANNAQVIKTMTPAGVDPAEMDPLVTFELSRGMVTALPEGWDIGQMKPEQPTTTYGDFKRQILSEIARCLQVPYGIAAGDHAPYNYASGRLDHQVYQRSIYIDQEHIATQMLDHVFREWLAEAQLIEGFLPREFLSAATIDDLPPREWFWDGFQHVDPSKEARAQAERLANHTSTLADEWAVQGWNWEEKVEQIAREHKRLRELGLPVPGAAPSPAEAEEVEDAA